MSEFKQGNLFDLEAGRRLKEEGMQLAAEAGHDILTLARRVAERIARAEGRVDIDVVQEALAGYGFKPGDLGQAAGSVFRGPQWRFVEFVESRRVGNHARMIRVWELIE